MALQAIAAFFVPLSADDKLEMYRAARCANLAHRLPSSSSVSINDTQRAAGPSVVNHSSNSNNPNSTTDSNNIFSLNALNVNDVVEADVDDTNPPVITFTPLRSAVPLAFVCAHPLCRVTAEASQEGVQIGFTHYERPEVPPLPSATYVWDITPPVPPELSVRITRLPLRTSGFSQGLWWLRYMRQSRPPDQPFHSPNAAVTTFPPFCPVRDIRVVLEREDPPGNGASRAISHHVSPASHTSGGVGAASPNADVVSGSKESPLCESDLTLVDNSATPLDCDVTGVPFTSLELQQLCFLPAAMRLLPCLFGAQLVAVLFSRCTCVYDPSLRDAQRCRYTLLPAGGDGGAVKIDTNGSSSCGGGEVRYGAQYALSVGTVMFPYGASNMTYLSASACGSEAFWSCVSKFFLFPQCADFSPGGRLPLTPLSVLDVGDNKSLSPKQLTSVLQAVKQRNTLTVVSSTPATTSADASSTAAQTELVSLRELNTSFTSAIKGVHWRRDFAGLGCKLTRLAMARCDVDGDAVVDVLCAGEVEAVHSAVSDTDEPFSAAVRRMLLLDMRWNVKVKSATVRQLRDEHAIHCKHLRIAGTGIEWEEGHRFATTVTP